MGRGKPGQGRTGGPGRSGKEGAGQPDPMQTRQGYIGADSFNRNKQEQSRKPRGARRTGGSGGRSR